MSQNEDQEYNPFSHSSIDEILRKREQKQDLEVLEKEELERFRLATNQLFNSDNGRYWLSRAMRYCHINTFDNGLNPAKLIEDRGKRLFFLEFILAHLDEKLRKELEL